MAAEDLLPAPWAWYRGDDLSSLHSEGDQVTLWPDRVGSNDLFDWFGSATKPFPQYTATAHQGKAGTHHKLTSSTVTESLVNNHGTTQFTNGFTIAFVGEVPSGIRNWFAQAGFWTANLWYGDNFMWSVISDGYFEVDPAPASSPGVFVMLVLDGSTVTALVDGVPLAFSYSEPVTELLQADRTYWNLAQDQMMAEVIVWDRALSSAEQVSAYDYYRCHYFGEGCPGPVVGGQGRQRYLLR